jgi:hypothetical protein
MFRCSASGHAFTPQHSTIFRCQTQLIKCYVTVTVALTGDRTRCSFRRRTRSAVWSGQRWYEVRCVWCVWGLPTAADYFPVSDELRGYELIASAVRLLSAGQSAWSFHPFYVYSREYFSHILYTLLIGVRFLFCVLCFLIASRLVFVVS